MAKTQWNTMNVETIAIFNAYGEAMYSVGEKYYSTDKICKGYYDIINNCESDLSKYAMGAYNGTRTVEAIRADLVEMSNKVAVFEKERDEYQSTFEKSVNDCESLFADLYKAYVKRAENIDDYMKSISTLFESFGVKLTDSTLKLIISKVGDNVESFRAIGKKMSNNKDTYGLKSLSKAKFCTIMARTTNELRGYKLAK